MKHISLGLLSGIVVSRRKTLKLSQTDLSRKAGINRSILSRLEAKDYSPLSTSFFLCQRYSTSTFPM